MKDNFTYWNINTIDDNTIQYIESLVRRSREYKSYIAYITEDNLGVNRLFKAYDTSDVTYELHHCITLYNLVLLCISKALYNQVELNPFNIAEEVIYTLHFCDYIPVAHIAKNVHELVHSGQYTLDKDEIHWGSYKDFLREYGKYGTVDMFRIYVTYNILSEDELKKYIEKE